MFPREGPLTSLDDLTTEGLIDPAERAALEPITARFPVRIPPTLRRRMVEAPNPGALRAQFVPSSREGVVDPMESADPIGDAAHSPLPGLVHRYPDRVLLKLVTACAVHCRFCFRRDMIGPDAQPALSDAQVETALSYVRARPGIREVILSGGDPLILPAGRIARVTEAVTTIDAVTVIRWHSRVPLVDPGRLSPQVIAALSGTNKTVVVAVHANHADEFGPEAETALARLRGAGVILVGQSVLLRGVNDSPEALEALMRTFLRVGVMPYYLHHGDLARGTGHFRTSLDTGLALVEGLRGRLSGLGQPTYVVDLPGGGGKVPVTRELLAKGGARSWTGAWHPYPPKG